MKRRKKPNRKAKPANEIAEHEVDIFLQAINRFEGYPRLRDLGRLLPAMSDYKINVILRYLQRLGSIVVDNDGYITWTRKERGKESLTLGDVADLSDDVKKFLNS